MPALPPPDMQIGALPPGYGPLAPTGPGLAQGFNLGLATLVQQVAGASSSAAPVTFTLSGITSTRVGTFLVACVALAESGAATVSTPTNWTAVTGANLSNAGNTLGGRVYVFPNNPGAITSVAFTTLTAVNGIAVWFGEFSNVYTVDSAYGTPGNGTYSNSAAAVSAPNYTPNVGPVLLVGMECDVTGQAYTAANIGGTWVAGTTATSTLGATNTIIRPFFAVTTPTINTPFQLAGSLAGAIASGASLVSLIPGTAGPLTQYAPEALASAFAANAWGWGPLGPTKPGGAGSGQ